MKPLIQHVPNRVSHRASAFIEAGVKISASTLGPEHWRPYCFNKGRFNLYASPAKKQQTIHPWKIKILNPKSWRWFGSDDFPLTFGCFLGEPAVTFQVCSKFLEKRAILKDVKIIIQTPICRSFEVEKKMGPWQLWIGALRCYTPHMAENKWDIELGVITLIQVFFFW